MDNSELKIRLESFGRKIYPPDKYIFSQSLLNEIESLNLGNNSIITAFLLITDLSNVNIKAAIKSEFGDEILKRIELVQRIGKIQIPDTQKRISRLRKLFIEITDDLHLIFIKLAERLTRLKELDKSPSEVLYRVAEECLYLYSPIAHRLGIRKFYTEMEDIAFKYLYPDDYSRLKKTIEKRAPELNKKLIEMKNLIKINLKKNSIPAQLQSRVKRLYSLFMKIKTKGINLKEIYDLMALRVITENVEHCYLTLGVVHRNWIPIEGRFRDWIAYPKPNGYRSIQTTILSKTGDKFEVQIRTKQMHKEAEYGSAAHWAYKEGTNAENTWIVRLKEFLENDEYFDNPDELTELLKGEMKRDFIHVLTPKGEVKTLPEGSSPIDFAYAVHTELGNKITGTRINGKYAKLKTTLHSGDIVEIITSNAGKPSRDWLNFVKTSKARSKISLWIKKNEKKEIIAEGKRQFEKLKKRFKSRLDGFDDLQTFRNNLIKTGYKSSDDFYSAIAINSLKCKPLLLKKLYPGAFKKEFNKKDRAKDAGRKQQLMPQLKVEGMKYIETTFAKCCNPIKGEPIFAYITKNSEIKIHAKRCSYLKPDYLDKDRLKDAEWLAVASVQKVNISVYGYNYNEVFTAMIDSASDSSVAILALDKKELHNSQIVINAEVEIKDIGHLNNFTAKLRNYNCIDSIKII